MFVHVGLTLIKEIIFLSELDTLVPGAKAGILKIHVHVIVLISYSFKSAQCYKWWPGHKSHNNCVICFLVINFNFHSSDILNGTGFTSLYNI